jgi:flagellar P-ring protein precursor FlgI
MASIKDVAKISTQRENYLMGYGLVVGLPQTGDTKSPLAGESLDNILTYTGIQTSTNKFQSKNTAAVLVMAKLPIVSSSGQQIDVWISSIGDAKSLSGGFLLQTPLMGQDGKIYAIAQSNIPVRQSNSRTIKSDTSTTLFITKGAIIEKNLEQPFIIDDNKFLLSMRTFDLVNLSAVQKTIEKKFPGLSRITSAGIIEITIPDNTTKIDFIAAVLSTPVEVKSDNKVVIDSQSGTIVMGNDVKISRVGLTKNGIIIKVSGNGNDSSKSVSNSLMEEAASVEELIKGLNTLGLSAEEIIDILKTIDAAGALHGDLILL